MQAAASFFSPAAATECISASNPLDASAQYFPPHMRITGDSGATAGAVTATVADDFSVHYENTFKVVNTFRGDPQTYILTLCGAVGSRRNCSPRH